MSVEDRRQGPRFHDADRRRRHGHAVAAARARRWCSISIPKDDTSGCTAEACGFRDSFPDYGRTGAVVIGVSKDSVASHDKFKKKYAAALHPRLRRATARLRGYGVWVEKSMYGRKYMGIERATFLIDKDGVVRGVWRKVKVPGHVAEVLKAAQAL